MEGRPIVFSSHAEDSMRKRGAIPKEVEHVIRTAQWVEARNGRLEATLDFPFGHEWNGKFYKTKQVNPVFVEEYGTIVVITVFVFFF